jgi:Na+/H+ antiporter NhaD/arsenite permease-like protein
MYSAIFAATVFLAVYALMITERFNRTVLALTGAGLLLVTDVLEPDEVLKRHIEWNTMLLLIGMRSWSGSPVNRVFLSMQPLKSPNAS